MVFRFGIKKPSLGEMNPWKSKGLGRPDGIHFTQEGYELLGKLLYNAIMKSYGAH